MTKIGKSNKW